MAGVLIGECHTEKDWGLLWTDLSIGEPEAQTKVIDIDGRDGALDLTDFLYGDIRYKNRPISITFVMKSDIYKWHSLKSEIANYIQGQKRKIILDTDKGFYYLGRGACEIVKENALINGVTISFDAEPYKYERYGSLEPWVWDTFCFEDGIIRDYRDLEVNGTMVLMIPGRRKKVVPVFECSESMVLEYHSISYTLPKGKSKVMDLQLGAGEHILTFQGKGTVSVDYRGASL